MGCSALKLHQFAAELVVNYELRYARVVLAVCFGGWASSWQGMDVEKAQRQLKSLLKVSVCSIGALEILVFFCCLQLLSWAAVFVLSAFLLYASTQTRCARARPAVLALYIWHRTRLLLQFSCSTSAGCFIWASTNINNWCGQDSEAGGNYRLGTTDMMCLRTQHFRARQCLISTMSAIPDKILIWVTFLVWLVFVIVHKISCLTFWGLSNNDCAMSSLAVHMCVLDQTQLLMGLAVRRHYNFKTTWAFVSWRRDLQVSGNQLSVVSEISQVVKAPRINQQYDLWGN